MNYHEDCRCCGHRITAYTLHLNRKLVVAFLKFVDKRVALRRPIAKGEIGLTNGEYGNFQNLRHFGIVSQFEKGSAWDLTPLGWRFLRGEIDLPTPVAHFKGETLTEDHLAWATHDGPRRRKYIRDLLPEDWKTRPEYQAEKRDAVA